MLGAHEISLVEVSCKHALWQMIPWKRSKCSNRSFSPTAKRNPFGHGTYSTRGRGKQWADEEKLKEMFALYHIQRT